MDYTIGNEKEALRIHMDHCYEQAMDIIYYLLAKGELSEEDDKNLYMIYGGREVQNAVERIADRMNVTVQRYSHVIYMIPNEDNEIIGMRMQDLRGIAGSKQTNVTAYLSMYLITLFIQSFYGGVGESLKTRDYISIREIVDLAGQRLEAAAAKETVLDEEEETGFNVISIHEHWVSLQEDDENHRKINTKYGYVRSVVNFLERQQLFVQYSYDNIRPTKKLTALMGHHFLDRHRKALIEKLFSEKSVLVEDDDAKTEEI